MTGEAEPKATAANRPYVSASSVEPLFTCSTVIVPGMASTGTAARPKTRIVVGSG